MVEVTQEQAKVIGKPIFVYNDEVHLVHLKGTSEDVPCFSSEGDFIVIGFDQLKEFKDSNKNLVVNFKNSFPDQRKLEILQDRFDNVRFTGANLIENPKVKLGVFSKESLEKRLSCRIKDNKSFVHKELVEIVPFSSEMVLEDFKADEVSVEGIRFGVARKVKKVGSAKFKFVFKKRKPLFEEGRVEF